MNTIKIGLARFGTGERFLTLFYNVYAGHVIGSPYVRAFCCADILCYFSPVLSLDKDRKLRVYSKAHP